MAEKGFFFFTDGFAGATGDGAAPYTEDEFRFYNRGWTLDGVVSLRGAELVVIGTSSPLEVGVGQAWCSGFLYTNRDASVFLDVTTPSVGTTGGRVVVRVNKAVPEIRLAIKLSPDGVASIPALVQDIATIYEISLATFTINTGGAIALTDDRPWAFPTTLKLDNATLERASRNILQVKDGGITAAKIGIGAIALTQRQGGDPTDYSTRGVSNYATGKVNVCVGAGGAVILSGQNSVTVAITLPQTFVAFPMAFVSVNNTFPLLTTKHPHVTQLGTTASSLGFVLATSDNTNVSGDTLVEFNWVVFGELP